jgi:ribosome-associated translation inhibitor RaiA
MVFSDESYNLRIELDQQGCDLTAEQIRHMEIGLDKLRKLTDPFPVSNLYITVVFHQPSQDYHVKTSLALPGKTLFTGDRDVEVHPAFERCVRKLMHKVASYKSRMSGDAELAKQAEGTRHMVTPAAELNPAEIQRTIDDGDYLQFHEQLEMFEGSLRERVGRWLQRYPEIESRLDGELQIDDLVEEVFLNAFEKFPLRSHDVPPGDWLEHLIDPSVQAILQMPDEEYANVSFVRSFREVV